MISPFLITLRLIVILLYLPSITIHINSLVIRYVCNVYELRFATFS